MWTKAAFALGLITLSRASATGSKCVVDACAALAAALPGDVIFPNSTMYELENTYWSERQEEVRPHCFVTPRKTAAVATTMKILTSLKAQFSVKGGGHTAFPGGSNVQDGVTVDLLHMTDIVVSEDHQTVSIGPGNRWINVSSVLDPLDLAVVAGRVADVGVSGLLLGGGISYFSGMYGWACDNVQNYEIVLASGEVANASPDINTDLYWALRGGGGSNFGIVTRYDLVAFPQGDLWSNTLILPGALNETIIPLFTNLSVNGLPEDPEAHTYLVHTYLPAFGGFSIISSAYHATVPSPPDSFPPVFQPYQTLPGALVNATSVTNISTASIAIDEPYGSRQTWWDTSVVIDTNLLLDIVPLWEKTVSTWVSAASNTNSSVTPFLVFQPISVNILTAMQKNGGNALGLKPTDGPLTLVQLSTTWEDSSLDSLIEDMSRDLIHKVETLAEERGLLKGFVYMNYAGSSQDVLKRYGKDNLDRLRSVASKYDPEGLLQKLWRGYFKLS